MDNGSWLKNNPISLDYFNWTEWINIASNIENDWEYIWNSDYIDSNNVKIKIWATDNVGNISYQNSNNFTVDSTDPTISSIETMDLDADWKIDALNIIMSEDIKDSTVSLSDFTISDWIWNPTWFETGNSINDNRFVLKFSNTWNTSLRPKVTYNKWGLTDIAWKYLSTYIDFSSIDKASPRLLESWMYDIDWNWKLDTIKAIFSESLYSTSDTSVWSIDNILNWITINSVSISGNQADIILNEWINYNTAVWSMKINLSSNSNWKDFSNNLVWNVVSWDIDDFAKPVIYNAEYFDDNSNYKVDRVLINFSENILWFDENDFNISWLNKWIWVSNNNQISFNIIETVLDNDTWVVSTLDFTWWNLKDSLDNFSDNVNNFVINDKVNPKLISKTTNDIDWNGKIDSIILTYSESLNSDFINFVWEVDSYNISNYSKLSDSKLLINLQEKDDYDSSETPLVRVISNSSLTDVNWNLVEEFWFTPSDDKVWPVIIWARYDESTHKIFIQTSENLNDSNFTIWNFVLNNAWSYSIIWANSIEKSITLSWENISFWNTSISFKANSVDDLFWNKQQVEYFTKISPPIIINEIMLSSNPSDNYIELKNLSSLSVDISNYTIAWITIPASSSIEANWYYLIAKDSKDNSILNVDANLTNSNLNISWTTLILNNWVMDVDFANLLNWLFDTSTPKSIERKDNAWDWLLTSSWYTAQDSVNFDNIVSFWTPKAQNMYDTISPTISSYTPSDNTLFPVGSFDINFVYSDNVWGLWVNTSSDNLSISKWNWSSWGTDISWSYLDSNLKLITSTSADYSVSWLWYGKYKIGFNISDKAWNLVSKTIIIYVDEFSFDLNTNSIDIWWLTSNFNVFSSNEAILTIKTVWAWFSIDLIKNWLLTNNWTDIIDFDWNYWFWYDQDNWGYSWIIKSIWNSVNITNVSKNINTNWDKNTFVYKIKFWAKIDIIQWAWIYEVNPNFKVLINY